MKKVAYLVLMLACLASSAQGQSPKSYFVAFFAEKPIIQNLSPGHAFVGIGKGIPLTCDMNGDSTIMVGFYPAVRIEGGLSLWFGPVPAQVRNDTRTDFSLYYSRAITFDQYIRVLIKIQGWQTRKYQLTKSDCVTFFADIANLFPDIVIPDRKKYALPEGFVREFISENGRVNK